ncbi:MULTISPECIES: inositol monophosphatase family protein [unclassified Ruegeria]|uniref:inositol monophosphatase family protein n=1 Tax=unclassified Ruegeria TaxID=2625375 RepID=UPI0014886BA7|nr:MULTISPECIES: inositol monophosphatase family protein [unclassified Ruegeria]NOD88011.1 inositol monophosphatase [Ruegeria sp. HKCCD4318]NOE14859.1 inositol monophosphatase [Ruegeria sp. HKCCD4318-2]NOG11538.1 inositol monophosphatase [Ruegeria sp. HKCCD4315]
MTDVENRLAFAKSLAQDAAALAVRLRDERGAEFIAEKGPQDFVTFADRAVEDLIRQRIAESWPDDAILGEEDGVSGSGNAFWVVDPIDGTANFMRGHRDWGVCIAFYDGQNIPLGVICAPDLNMLAWASVGGGAWLNEKRLSVSTCAEPTRSQLMLGWSTRRPFTEHTQLIEALLGAGIEYRRNGSAAISLLAVATGQAEGYYEAHLNPWDAFAAIPMIQEAGGQIDCEPLDEFLTQGSQILASGKGMHLLFREKVSGHCQT